MRSHHGVASLLLAMVVASWGGATSQALPPPNPSQPALEPVPDQDDPRMDGWDTEVFSNLIGVTLKEIGQLLSEPSGIDETTLRPYVAADISTNRLRPAKLQRVFEDQAITVSRWNQLESHERYHGAVGFAEALRALAAPLAKATEVHFKFKVFRVDPHAGGIRSRQFFSMSGLLADGSLEQHATWDCDWTIDATKQTPQLKSVKTLQYEQVRVRSNSQSLFADCTQALLAHNECFEPQLMRGIFDWSGQIESLAGIGATGLQGPTVGDVNGDGLEDLFVCQSGGLPNRLFLQNLDGTATDRSAWARVDYLDQTRCALLVDLDNDGDQDLVLGLASGVLILANDSTGRFARNGFFLAAGLQAHGFAAADYDLDGDLDLYVCRYQKDLVLRDVPNPIPYHDANNGGTNLLLENKGDLNFHDVTGQTGMDTDNTRWSFAACWDDYDNDGDPDLYVANDFGRNCLYQNDDGHFVNVAARAGIEDIASGMSTTWGDYNRDGLMDMYVSNMWSSAGGRITFQPKFQPGIKASTKSLIQRLARGNSLFANNGDGTFTDVSLEAGVTMGRWSWGSLFVDLNNDGWEDLVVANGFMTAPDTNDL